jgi:hypothetical protein
MGVVYPLHARALFTGVRGRFILRTSALRSSKKFVIRCKDSSFGGCGLQLRLVTVVASVHSGAAIKANPPRGGGAKPKGLLEEIAGLPKGG